MGERIVARCGRNLERFVTEQPPYSILVRGIEEDVLPTTRRHRMGTLTYSPLAGGWLSGRWRTSAIVGPRTMEQLESYLPASELTLSTDVLDRIDQIVAPGVTLNPDDNSYAAHEHRD